MRKILLPVPVLLAGVLLCVSLRGGVPTRLVTDLAEHTDRVWVGGRASQVALEGMEKAPGQAECVRIFSRRPSLGWQVEDARGGVMQTAWRVLVASSVRMLAADSADLWDSGLCPDSRSTAVPYAGPDLKPGRVYYWKVMTWNNGEPQPWSAVRAFRTADTLADYRTPFYPLEKTDEQPLALRCLSDRTVLADFGRAAFAQLCVTLTACRDGDTATVRLGECLRDGRIDPSPGGSRRFLSRRIPLMRGTHTYTVTIPPDSRNTAPRAIHMPAATGEVYPFRYAEIKGDAVHGGVGPLVRQAVHYPFDEQAASFESSDTTLNRVWELCKYSIKATSFAGLYVDGDRERIPYEADALINQLSHYAVDREYTMARRTHEYLLENPTWPTEWILQSVLIAWEDYLYTGDLRSVEKHYALLQSKALPALADADGFIRVTDDRLTPEFYESIRLRGQKLQNIVDWPHTGTLGLGKNEGGESDGYVFTEVNTVVNAYRYRALDLLSRMAAALGRDGESEDYRRQAAQLATVFNKRLFDRKTGAYRDGISTDHRSLHGNMFPLCFGMAEPKNVPGIVRFMKSRGMACSVYGSQFLLDALYEAGEAGYALRLLASDAERSWYNMIRVGSTVSLEAWDNKYKPNQDWNHAWGAAPANLIPRRLMGVEPLEPGFARIRIRPQPDTLRRAELRLPTPRGDVQVAFKNDPRHFAMSVVIPANTKADVYLPLPAGAKNYRVELNGRPADDCPRDGNFVLIPGQGSGKNDYTLTIQ